MVPGLLRQLQSHGRAAMVGLRPGPGPLQASQPQQKTAGTAAPLLLPGDAKSVCAAQASTGPLLGPHVQPEAL